MLFLSFIPISDLSITKPGTFPGTAVAGDRSLKTGTVPGNRGRLVTLVCVCVFVRMLVCDHSSKYQIFLPRCVCVCVPVCMFLCVFVLCNCVVFTKYLCSWYVCLGWVPNSACVRACVCECVNTPVCVHADAHQDDVHLPIDTNCKSCQGSTGLCSYRKLFLWFVILSVQSTMCASSLTYLIIGQKRVSSFPSMEMLSL